MIQSENERAVVRDETEREMAKPYQRRAIDQTTTNKMLIRKVIEDLWNNGDEGAAVQYLNSNYTDYTTGPAECTASECTTMGPDRMKALIRCFRSAFPNIRFYILQMIAEKDRVAVHFIGAGTHMGNFGNLAPTGHEVDIIGVAIHHVAGGKIADSYHFFHIVGLR